MLTRFPECQEVCLCSLSTCSPLLPRINRVLPRHHHSHFTDEARKVRQMWPRSHRGERGTGC